MTIKISNLSKRDGNGWILRDVSFTAEPGMITGIAGENSRAKTMLLKIIGGQEKANGGEIANTIEEKLKPVFISGLAPPKNRSLFSVFTNLAGSEQQDCDFESGLESAENVLLLDNPFLELDLFQKEESIKYLREAAHRKNLTVILAANTGDEIFAACDELVVLAEGSVFQTGTPREIYEKPNSLASARALGRCNLLGARRVTFNNQTSLEFQTLSGGHRLVVDKTDKSELGAITSNISLAIRPEHISISFGASFPEDNLLKAVIAEIQYQGATTLLKLNANGLKLEALVLRLVGLNVGDECMVGLPPDRILVLKH